MQLFRTKAHPLSGIFLLQILYNNNTKMLLCFSVSFYFSSNFPAPREIPDYKQLQRYKINFMDTKLQNNRHTLAHLLAAAIMELYPKTKRTIGPAIDNGFYFDFDFADTKITDADLPKIEEKNARDIANLERYKLCDVNKTRGAQRIS
jgi:hypothetical protein